MTSPIVLRSEILSLLQTGGLGNAGTSGQSTLASLNSQLISITSRVAKLEGSATYNEETAAAESFWFDDNLGICIASGSLVITSSVAEGASIKLLTIDSANHLPLHDGFLGAANAYMSTTAVGSEPKQMALSFDNLDLMATAEAYIPANSSSSWFIQFQTMWIMRSHASSSNMAHLGWGSNTVNAETDYLNYIISGGVVFMCGYIKTVTGSGSVDISTPYWSDLGSTYEPTGMFWMGPAYAKLGTTVSTIRTVRTNSADKYWKFTGVPGTSSLYFYTILYSKTASNVSLGQYSTSNNEDSTNYSYPKSAAFHCDGFYALSFFGSSINEWSTTSAWNTRTLMVPSLLDEGVSYNFATCYVTGISNSFPINVNNGRVEMVLKPDLPSGNKGSHCTLILIPHKTA